MGWTDTAKELTKEIIDLLKQVATLETQIGAVKDTVEKTREDQRDFIEQTHQRTRDLEKDMDEIRRRLARIEGTIDQVFQKSFVEAMTQMAREHLDEHGTLDDFGAPKRLLGTDHEADDD